MRKVKLFPAFVLGAFCLSLAIVGCNSEGDSKEVKKDSTTVIKTDTMVPVVPKDTTKMDTTAVNKKVDKPIVTP